MDALRESIRTIGLQWPVPLRFDGRYLFYSGGLRIHAALLDEYTHISCDVRETVEELEALKLHQAKQEEKYFADELIDRWWEEPAPG